MLEWVCARARGVCAASLHVRGQAPVFRREAQALTEHPTFCALSCVQPERIFAEEEEEEEEEDVGPKPPPA